MSLAHLYDPLDTVDNLIRFIDYNYIDHASVVNSMLVQRGVNLILLDIRFADLSNLGTWGLNHQSMHAATNAVFGFPGSDFSRIDFNDKSALATLKQLHAEEHRRWHDALGLG